MPLCAHRGDCSRDWPLYNWFFMCLPACCLSVLVGGRRLSLASSMRETGQEKSARIERMVELLTNIPTAENPECVIFTFLPLSPFEPPSCPGLSFVLLVEDAACVQKCCC